MEKGKKGKEQIKREGERDEKRGTEEEKGKKSTIPEGKGGKKK